MLAACGRRVDLDPIAEGKNSFGPRTLPDERVEWREQSVRIELARRGRITRDERGLWPSFDGDRDQLAGLDEFLDTILSGAATDAKVIAEIFFGRYAKRARSDPN